MNKENTKKLLKRFPLLYRGYYKDMRQTCMCWGFSCGDGWFDLLWMLSLAIEDELKRNCGHTWLKIRRALLKSWFARKWNRLMFRHQPKWLYRKTDFGPIARWIMWSDSGVFEVTQVKEKFGGLRFYTQACNSRIHSLISLAERVSYHTCEECGKYGSLRGQGWLYVSCNEHAREGDSDEDIKAREDLEENEEE